MRSLPNLLSLARLLAAAPICVLLGRREYFPALGLIALAAITDGLDGYLARVLRAQSHFGEVFDPIADKILMGAVFLTLAFTGEIDAWLAWMVVLRDVGILSAGGFAWLTGKGMRRFPPSIWGKLSTSFQVAFTVALLGWLAALLPQWPVETLKWMVAGMTVFSGLDYAARFLRAQ